METKPQPQYYVLCIGVNKAPGSGLIELDYAEKGASAAASYFETLKENARVTRLIGKDATRTGITRWCEECNAIPVNLTVIVFFAGHGTARKRENKENPERCLWIDGNEHAEPGKHRLLASEILKLLNNPFHRLIFILDACYTFDNPLPTGERVEKFEASERVDSLKGYAIISSSATHKSTYEDPQLKYGVLTFYFLRIISGKYTFFLKKKIPFFRLLQMLDKKVKNHLFTTNTGRKRKSPMPGENGLMVHYSHKSLQLPILEPIPFIEDSEQTVFQEKRSRWVHFFTRTRLRSRLSLTGFLAIMVGLFIYLLNGSMVRIHFVPFRQAVFHHTLLGKQHISLDKLDSEKLGAERYREFNFYLFKANWTDALLHKLDEKGKIILLGNLLGAPLKGIDEKQIVDAALGTGSRHDVFYWNIEDIYGLLRGISSEFSNLNKNRQKNALELLAKLGRQGRITASGSIRLSRETDQDLRNLFLKHFYTIDLLEKNIDYINPNDYLYLIRNKKPIPPDKEAQLRKKAERYINIVSESIPELNLPLIQREKLWNIYNKLEILAAFGSKKFKEKASAVFRKAFDPQQFFHLAYHCRNLTDKMWVLEQYFTHVQEVDFPIMDTFWPDFLYQFVPKLPGKEKARVIKLIINNTLDQVPEFYQRSLFEYLQRSGDPTVTLKHWEKWLKKHHVRPDFIFYPVIDMDYADIFPFLQEHYKYFKNLFTEPVFNGLFEFNKSEAVNLAKKIFETGDGKDRLHAAVFLYNKNHPWYSSFIVEFLERSKHSIHHRRLLAGFHGGIDEAVLRLIANNNHLKEKLKSVLNHPTLLYRFFKIDRQLWPEEFIQRILTSEIPGNYNEGVPFIRLCERLPDAYRREMLVKICQAGLEEGFKWSAESKLAEHYPAEFLVLVFNKKYKWGRTTAREVIEAYQAFPYQALINKLVLNIREKSYKKVGFICEALIGKSAKEPLDIQDLKQILETFDRPRERILLRKLRYYVHERYFKDMR